MTKEKKLKRKQISEEVASDQNDEVVDSIVPSEKSVNKSCINEEENKFVKPKPENVTREYKPIVFPCSDKEIYDNESMAAVKKFAKGFQAQGLLSSKGAQLMVRKWQKRNDRRAERREERRWTNKECFNCRQVGHFASDCQALEATSETGMGICFKCGSTEHKIKQCRLKVKGFPFAQCFICGERGHISRDCSDNPNGVYPKGGNCKECGSKEHLIRDCPELKVSANYEELVLRTFTPGEHASVEEEDNVLLSTESEPKKKKSKVVKMC